MYDSESSSDGGWISWFCDLEGHEFFVEVSEAKTITCNSVDISSITGGRGLYQGLIQLVRAERARTMQIQVSHELPFEMGSSI